MRKNPTLTVERVHEALDYDLLTGVFRWKLKRPRVIVGDIAGNLQTDGYWRLCIDGSAYKAHHVAWLYVHGVWPIVDLDHRNGVRSDNRIANLRVATTRQNAQNQTKPQRGNRSGYLGVWQHGNRWRATIRDGEQIHRLGNFATPEQAHAAYLAAKEQLHPFWRER